MRYSSGKVTWDNEKENIELDLPESANTKIQRKYQPWS